MLSELFKELLERSDFETETSLAKSVFKSDDRKHRDFVHKQFAETPSSIKRLGKVFEVLVGDISVSEIVDAIEYTKKIKQSVKNDFL